MTGCHFDEDCSYVANSRCSFGLCQCRSGYVSSDNKYKCTLRKLEEACSIPKDCSDAILNSTCVENKCTCIKGFHRISNILTTCLALKVNDVCDSDEECEVNIANSNCRYKNCQCNKGYLPSLNLTTCIIRKVIELDCLTNIECESLRKNSACDINSKKCVCQQGYLLDSDKVFCNQLIVAMLPCSDVNYCQIAMVNTYCSSNQVCDCIDGYYPSTNKNFCTNVTLQYTECSGPSDTICLNSVLNSECRNFKCVCQEWHHSLDGRSCLGTQIGKPCSRDDHCNMLTANSYCKNNNTCFCLPDYHSLDNVTCTEILKYSSSSCNSVCIGLLVFFLIFFAVILTFCFFIFKFKYLPGRRKRKIRPSRKEAVVAPIVFPGQWQLDWDNRPPAHVPIMYKNTNRTSPQRNLNSFLELSVKNIPELGDLVGKAKREDERNIISKKQS